jgi:hypothetical protein
MALASGVRGVCVLSPRLRSVATNGAADRPVTALYSATRGCCGARTATHENPPGSGRAGQDLSPILRAAFRALRDGCTVNVLIRTWQALSLPGAVAGRCHAESGALSRATEPRRRAGNAHGRPTTGSGWEAATRPSRQHG